MDKKTLHIAIPDSSKLGLMRNLKAITKKNIELHAAKITLLDKQVGRLLEKLKDINQLDNTLILFTSDNGPHYAKDGHELEFFDSNGQFKGGKRDLYEGGIRVPLIAYWDQNILPGSVSNHVSSFQDIMPTFS